MRRFFALTTLMTIAALSSAQTRSPRDGLQPLGDLVGTWRGTGAPIGSREEQQKGFWVESLECGWKFKGTDAWLVLAFDKSKHYKAGELRYQTDKDRYQLSLTPLAGPAIVLHGELKNKILTLTSEDEKDRLVFTLLHENRFLYRHERRAEGKTAYAKIFQVGATKEGVPFAKGAGGPECVVTGGLGTSPVTYLGKTYYVCCSGCRDEFAANPAMYVKEFEAKKAKK
ncbi:MAG: hypothetical protein WCL32_14790 [Planctomycetota bacterium]